MSMDQEQFEALVGRMDALARDHPQAYRQRVFALAGLGYAYLALLVLVLGAITVGAALAIVQLKWAAIKLILIFGGLFYVVLRALWVKLEEPQGEPVSRADAPALFEMLDRLRERLQTPRIDRVLLTAEFNAAVTQVPRLGLFGWYRSFLLIGLPLMKSLTPAQFESVLAHELGHLSGGHARAGNWIYRLRLIWSRLEAALGEQDQWTARIALKFFHWYIPYFRACSYPLARANEFEADAASARLTSPRSAGQALTNVSVVASYLDEHYWPRIHRTANDMAQPRFAPYSEFNVAAAAELTAPETERWLREALARTTTYADTHPCLAERLAALGATAEFVVPAAGEAADRLLGASRARYESTFDAHWRDAVTPSWTAVYEGTQKNRTRLAELRTASAATAQEERAVLELADLEESVGGGLEEAARLLQGARERYPDSLPVRYAHGRVLLLREDEAGVPLIEAVIASDIGALLGGADLLRQYYWRRGDKTRTEHWHARYQQRVDELNAVDAEQSTIRLKDSFERHDLDAPTLAALRAELRTVPHLGRVYLLRKLIPALPQVKLYVLGFRVKTTFGLYRKTRMQEAMAALTTRITLPEGTAIISVDGDNYRFRRKFRWMRGAKIL